MDTYEKRRSWADQFLPRVREIVGPHLMEASPYTIDTEQATDLVVMRGKAKDVAVRIRRHRYLDEYGDQFTLRARVNGNCKTEVEKILHAGFGDLMFYGFGAKSGPPDLAKWVLIDLDAFRGQCIRSEGRKELCTGLAPPNGDGTRLRWFRIQSLREEALIDAAPAVTHEPALFDSHA